MCDGADAGLRFHKDPRRVGGPPMKLAFHAAFETINSAGPVKNMIPDSITFS